MFVCHANAECPCDNQTLHVYILAIRALPANVLH